MEGKQLLDGTVAAVGKTIITVREARLYRAIQRFKDREKDTLGEERLEDLKKTAQKIALEEMLRAESKAVQLKSEERSEAERLLLQARQSLGGSLWKMLLARFDVTEQDVVVRLSRSLEAERFLQKKIETLTPIITDAEVESRFKKDPTMKDKKLETVKSELVLQLKKEQMQKGLEDWIRSLKEKYGFVSYL